MKTLLFKILALSCVVFIIYSCNNSITDEGLINETSELKSATTEKTSYIVVLNDAELNVELPKLKEYEKKQEKVRSVSEKILSRASVTDGEIQLVYGSALQGFSVMMPPGQLKKLQEDPSVSSVTEDMLITLDLPSVQEVSAASTQVLPWGINRVNGGVSYNGDHVIWIIDTGIDLDHPDLNVDDTRDVTYVTRTSSGDDDNGHGTHCAGIAAAYDNDLGVIGVAAGATVIPVKVLNSKGSGYYSWIIAGVNYVAGNGKAGDVANMSLGGSLYEPLNTAVKNAAGNGILFSLAAGNESTDASTRSPASAEHPNIYTISAMDSNDNFAYFSNYGNPPVDYCEPGVSIYSTYKGGGYATMSGTSMAAPHMAGILLLTGGNNIPTDGTVKSDPDGNPDPIAVAVGGGSSSNTPPVAVINGPYSGNEDDVITFNASGSSDEDGDVLSYTWNFGDGTTTTTSNATTTHTYLWGAGFAVTLTVTDGKGGSDSKTTTATITEINDKPVANAGGPYNGVAGQPITFYASGSSDYDNEDGSATNNQALSYTWDFGDGTVSPTNSTTITHTYTGANTYSVKLVVNDGITDSDIANTTATISEQSPEVAPTFTDWTVVNTSNPALKRVQITWSVTDENGDLATVVSTLKDPAGKTVSTTTAVSGSSASGIHELLFKKGVSGTYTVVTVVTDQQGNTDTKTGTINL